MNSKMEMFALKERNLNTYSVKTFNQLCVAQAVVGVKPGVKVLLGYRRQHGLH